MLTIKITFGGGDALISRSYQVQGGEVCHGPSQSAGLSVLPPDSPIRKAPQRTADGCRLASVSALFVLICLSQGDSAKSWAPIHLTKGVGCLVSFGGEPARVDDGLIETLSKPIAVRVALASLRRWADKPAV